MPRREISQPEKLWPLEKQGAAEAPAEEDDGCDQHLDRPGCMQRRLMDQAAEKGDSGRTEAQNAQPQKPQSNLCRPPPLTAFKSVQDRLHA